MPGAWSSRRCILRGGRNLAPVILVYMGIAAGTRPRSPCLRVHGVDRRVAGVANTGNDCDVGAGTRPLRGVNGNRSAGTWRIIADAVFLGSYRWRIVRIDHGTLLIQDRAGGQSIEGSRVE